MSHYLSPTTRFSSAALRSLISALAVSGLLSVSAQDDSSLPQPLPRDAFETLLQSSPFTRTINLSDSLLLSGLAVIDGKPVATIFNKETKENYVVGTEVGPNGWKLVEIEDTQGGLEKSRAKLDIGGQLITVRFDGEELMSDRRGGKPGGRMGGGRSGGDGKGKPGFRPDPELMKRFYTLSEESRQKFREKMMAMRESGKDLSPEERMNAFKKTVESLEKGEKKKK